MLAIDTDMTKGQVRKVRAAFVDELAVQFGKSRPETLLELIVWPDQGVTSLFCFCCQRSRVCKH